MRLAYIGLSLRRGAHCNDPTRTATSSLVKVRRKKKTHDMMGFPACDKVVRIRILFKMNTEKASSGEQLQCDKSLSFVFI
ncbi:unnamed protein product [Urochloa humidicola]